MHFLNSETNLQGMLPAPPTVCSSVVKGFKKLQQDKCVFYIVK